MSQNGQTHFIALNNLNTSLNMFLFFYHASENFFLKRVIIVLIYINFIVIKVMASLKPSLILAKRGQICENKIFCHTEFCLLLIVITQNFL